MITKGKLSTQFLVFLIVPIVLLSITLGYLYKERYLTCITQNLSLCLQSKKYTSIDGGFIFRYPVDYPLTFKTGDQMKSQYGFDDKYKDWVNFSSEFYPNAGGERLGSVIVTKNTTYKDIGEYALKELTDFKISPTLNYQKIGGKSAVCASLKRQPHSFSEPSYNCYVINNNLLYRMSFDYNNYYHKLPIEYYQSAQQLILSTFTFY